MKRFVIALLSSVAGLYFALTYKMPVAQVAAANETSSMTLSPDGVAAMNATPAAGGDTGTTAAAGGATAGADATQADAGVTQTVNQIIGQATGGQAGGQGAASGIPAGTGTGTGTGTAAAGQAAPAATAAITAPASKTVNGPVANTKYGPVQVSITVQGNTITGVQALQHPTGGTSDGINAMAVPKLQSETLQAQSANVASVSGATYTSGGWKTSLQGAITSAGI